MRSFIRIFLLSLLPVALTPAAWAAWPPMADWDGVPICTATGTLARLRTAVPDGSGGLITAWQDDRSIGTTGADIYAQRLNLNGDPVWTPNGLPVSTASGTQKSPTCVADGSGGVFLVWASPGEQTVFAQHLDGSGAALWGPGPVPVCGAITKGALPVALADGSGGLFVAWWNINLADTNSVRVQHLSSAGARTLAADGVVLANGIGALLIGSLSPGIDLISDTAGGVIVAWELSYPVMLVYVQRVNPAGTALWTAGGIQAAYHADSHVIAPDGFGGVVLAYRAWDTVANTYTIRVQRYASFGAPAQWGASGAAVSSPSAGDLAPAIAANPVDGVYVGWEDYATHRIRVQRVTGGGLRAWGNDGIDAGGGALNMSSSNEGGYLDLLEDGENGVVASWRTEGGGLFAQRFDINANKLWGADGVAVWTGPASHCGHLLASPGHGYLVVSASQAYQWTQQGNGDVTAKLIWADGRLGAPGPAITSVSDVPGDQGGKIRVTWTADPRELLSPSPVSGYALWRRLPAAQAAQVLTLPVDPKRYRVERGGLTTLVYEVVGNTPAYGFAGYGFTVSTSADSTVASNPFTAVLVEAQSSELAGFSLADSGYSVDNLAPFPPTPLPAIAQQGGVRLHWLPATAADLLGYRLYRSVDTSSALSAATFITFVPDTAYLDTQGEGPYYRLTAVDRHGNESPPVSMVFEGTTGAPLPSAGWDLELAGPSPNPLRAGAGTLLRFSLPARGPARLVVYDAAGRSVRTLASGMHEAGGHSVAFDGRDDRGGAVSPGLYFAKLETSGGTRVRRLAVTR